MYLFDIATSVGTDVCHSVPERFPESSQSPLDNPVAGNLPIHPLLSENPLQEADTPSPNPLPGVPLGVGRAGLAISGVRDGVEGDVPGVRSDVQGSTAEFALEAGGQLLQLGESRSNILVGPTSVDSHRPNAEPSSIQGSQLHTKRIHSIDIVNSTNLHIQQASQDCNCKYACL